MKQYFIILATIILTVSCTETTSPASQAKDIFSDADTACNLDIKGRYEQCVNNSYAFYKVCDGSKLLGYGNLVYQQCIDNCSLEARPGALDWDCVNRLPLHEACAIYEYEDGSLAHGISDRDENGEQWACWDFDYSDNDEYCISTGECGHTWQIFNSPYLDIIEAHPELLIRVEEQIYPY